MKEKKLCGAKTKSGGTCKQPAKANGRCRYHFGNMPVGPAHPRYKHGRYSKVKMPEGLKQRYDVAMADPEYLSMRSELAILDGMLSERLETLADSGSDDLWSVARKQLGEFEAAMSSGDVASMRQVFVQLRETINSGASEAAARLEVRNLIKERKQLTESITKQMVSMRQVVTVEQSMALVARLIDMIESGVSDRKERAALLGGIVEVAQLADRAEG